MIFKLEIIIRGNPKQPTHERFKQIRERFIITYCKLL